MEASEAMDVVDKLTSIDLKAATSAGEIASGLAKFANIGSLSGVSIDQAAAYVATIADVTQMSGDSAGQALKTIIARYGNVKAGAYNKLNVSSEDTDEGAQLNDVEKVLNKIGISIRSTNLEFKDFDEVLGEIATKWGTLDRVSQKAIANAFAGIRQQESFLTLLENWNKYEELLKASEYSEGTASRKFEAYKEGLEAATNKLTTAIESLVNGSETSEVLIDLKNAAAKIVEFLPKILKLLPNILYTVGTIKNSAGQGLGQKIGWSIYQGVHNPNLPQAGKTNFWGKIFGFMNMGAKNPLTAWQIGAANNGGTITNPNVVNNTSNALNQVTNAANSAAQAYKNNSNAVNDNSKEKKKERTAIARATKEQKDHTKAVKKDTEGTEEHTEQQKQKGMSAQTAVHIATAVSQILNMGAAAASAYLTGGTSHTYTTYDENGNKVDKTATSSERAKQAGRMIESIGAVIPLLGLFTPLLFNAVMANIDKERDAINEISENATKIVSTLKSLDSSIETLSTDINSPESQQAIEKILSELYTSENQKTRELLEYNLEKLTEGKLTSIYELLGNYTTQDEKSRKETARYLKIIQKQTQYIQEQQKRATENYNAENRLAQEAASFLKNQGKLNINNTDLNWATAGIIGGWGAGGAVTGLLTGGIGAGIAAAAASGAAMGTAGTAWSGPGAAIGAIAGAIIGLGIGIWQAVDNYQTEQKARETEYAKNQVVSYTELYEQAQKALVEAQKEGNTQLAAQAKEYIKQFEDYANYIRYNWDQDNKNALEIALLKANENEEYLTDLTLEQAKAMDPEKIAGILAKEAADEGLLQGRNIYDKNGKLTSWAKTQLLNTLQLDAELSAAITGEAYTLKEALEKLDDSNEDNWIQKGILDRFREALFSRDLQAEVERFGDLTLGDLLMNSSELTSKIGEYNDLLTTVANSQSSVSEWTNKIITQYPQLIQYMSETPKLMEQIVKVSKQLNDRYIYEEFNQLSDKDEFFTDVFWPALKESFSEEEWEKIEAWRQNPGEGDVPGITDVFEFLTALDRGEALDEDLLARLGKAAVAFGNDIRLTSDQYKELLENYINVNTQLLQEQVDSLTAQKDALNEINTQREYELKLIEARNKLEDAMNDKRRIYRAGVGFVYEADQQKINEAEKNLRDVENQKNISKITEQITLVNQQIKDWSSMWDKKQTENNRELASNFQKTFLGQNGDIGSAVKQGMQAYLGSEVAQPWIASETFTQTMSEYFADYKDQKGAFQTNLKSAYQRLSAAWNGGNVTNVAEYQDALDAYYNLFKEGQSKGYYTTRETFDKYFQGPSGMQAWDFGINYSNDKYQNPITEYVINQDEQAQTVSTTYKTGVTWQNPIYDDSNPSPTRGEEIETGYALSAITKTPLQPGQSGYVYIDKKTKFEGFISSDGKSESANNWVNLEKSMEDTSTFLSDFSNRYPDGGFAIYRQKNGEPAAIYIKDGQMYAADLEKYSNGTGNFVSLIDTNTDWDNFRSLVERGRLAWPFDCPVPRNDAEYWAYVGEGKLPPLSKLTDHLKNMRPGVYYARGNLDLGYGPAIVNELGTEAIVTPEGTITTLPSHTGIVPADITKNLWTLGEVAPSILRVLEGGISSSSLIPAGVGAVEDNSFNINNLQMDVHADEGFDADAFVAAIKSRVALTKNTKM